MKLSLATLEHALLHLRKNHIHLETGSGWYTDNRAQFVKRHITAIEEVKAAIEKATKGTKDAKVHNA